MEPEQKSNGALVGLIIIIIILILGGIYLWSNNQKKNSEIQTGNEQTSKSSESTAEIEANLNNMDLESLDSEI